MDLSPGKRELAAQKTNHIAHSLELKRKAQVLCKRCILIKSQHTESIFTTSCYKKKSCVVMYHLDVTRFVDDYMFIWILLNFYRIFIGFSIKPVYFSVYI